VLASLLFNAYMQVSFFSISTLLRSLFLSLSYSLALAPSLPFLLHHCLLRVRSIEFEKVYIVAFICHSISLFTIRKKNNKRKYSNERLTSSQYTSNYTLQMHHPFLDTTALIHLRILTNQQTAYPKHSTPKPQNPEQNSEQRLQYWVSQ
jgi:hypothetical protein